MEMASQLQHWSSGCQSLCWNDSDWQLGAKVLLPNPVPLPRLDPSHQIPRAVSVVSPAAVCCVCLSRVPTPSVSKAAGGSCWRLAGTWIWELQPWEQGDVMDRAEPALGRNGGRADVPPRTLGKGKNPNCGVLLVGHFPLASSFAPFNEAAHRAGQTGVVNKSRPRSSPGPPRGF